MSVANEQWVWLAQIRRPQGRKGEVFADILTDFPEKFEERRDLWLLPNSSRSDARPPQQIELTAHWLHKGGVVLHFAGITSISEAETLAGLIVAIPRSERAALGPDEVHIADLIGCELVDLSGGDAKPVGTIENVDRSAGPVPILILKGAKGEVLIPFAQSYLRKLDIEAKRIEMTLPEGLVDLNN